MRPRKRADWPIVVYRYHVRPRYETWATLPDGAQREIAATRTLWNQLLAAFEQRNARYRAIVAQAAQDADGGATRRSALVQLQQAFLAETRRVTAACPATWANREFVLTQFLATVTRFFKNHRRVPKPKHGVPQEVHFHHRFADGGVAVQGIFGRSKRLRLEPVSSDVGQPALSQRQRKRLARTTGVFQVGDTPLPFQLLLHRPLPEGGILKAAALIGKQVVRAGFRHDTDGEGVIAARWVWSLYLTVEIPPRAIPAREKTSSPVVLDLSEQLGGEGQLRIGVLVEPVGCAASLFLPEEILRAWRYKRELQSHSDQLVNETKEALQKLKQAEQLPVRTRSLLAHVGAMHSAGLWRLLQTLEKTRADETVRTLMRRWATRTSRLTREMRGLERRYLAHRDWFYRNLALQLCQRYSQIQVKLPARCQSAEAGEDERARQGAATYRHLAAPSTLLSFLQQAAVKTGASVEKVLPQRHSTPAVLRAAPAA